MEYTRGYVMTYENKCIGIKLMKRTCTVNVVFKQNLAFQLPLQAKITKI